ncbi:unnamed protein product, partial [Pleuronectes platessa]
MAYFDVFRMKKRKEKLKRRSTGSNSIISCDLSVTLDKTLLVFLHPTALLHIFPLLMTLIVFHCSRQFEEPGQAKHEVSPCNTGSRLTRDDSFGEALCSLYVYRAESNPCPVNFLLSHMGPPSTAAA